MKTSWGTSPLLLKHSQRSGGLSNDVVCVVFERVALTMTLTLLKRSSYNLTFKQNNPSIYIYIYIYMYLKI